MGQKFAGQVALVTGGGRGMGAAHARGFAALGAAVVVADILGEPAGAVADQIVAQGGQAIAAQVDVEDEESVKSMVRLAEERFARLDFVVNNAAVMLDLPVPFKPFWETDWAEWKRIMNVNAGGIFLVCKHVQPIMARQGHGRIVNISSDAIYKGYESQLAYFASKGAVSVMTRNLAREFGPFNVNVNAVAPGYTTSEANLSSEFMQSVRPLIEASCAIKLEQRPEDVTGAVLFLCGPESACITGQSIVVNCGAIMP